MLLIKLPSPTQKKNDTYIFSKGMQLAAHFNQLGK
jgi:hypothetical protein